LTSRKFKINSISPSYLKRRWKKFKKIKRGYYSLLILIFLYFISLILPVFIGNSALFVRYNGKYYFPLFKNFSANEFEQHSRNINNSDTKLEGEANYRWLKQEFDEKGENNFVILALYPYGPNENLLDEMEGNPPHPPSMQHTLGTDDRGRDVLSRLVYGFNISLSFSIIVTFFTFLFGFIFGALLGYYGGKFDFLGLRLIEIWSTLPVIYILIIISSIIRPNFFWLTLLLILFGWVGITYYIRGEVYREKAKDYTMAAIAIGASDLKVIFKHIMPNALVPVISFVPFALVGYIISLVSLDFLGFGLPPPTPSWGELISQGLKNTQYWWLVSAPLGAQFFTLLMIVFIGEGVREAFDPKPFSRYK
jgi:microcin C transport system permease protein